MTVAAIDIGSNSVRLLVIDDEGKELVRASSITALGKGVEVTGYFDAEAYDATVKTIARYATTIADLGVETIRAVATSASRDARNGSSLMRDVERTLGIKPSIIDGPREAHLAFAGATTGLDDAETKLVIDVGGGSTEFVFGTTVVLYAESVDMGAIRLTDRCIRRRPVSQIAVNSAMAVCDEVFARVEVPRRPATAVGVGGTFTSLAAIALGLHIYSAEAVHGSQLTAKVAGDLIVWLSKLSVEETATIPSLEDGRARAILAGAIVVERALARCGIDSVMVSDRGLLDGLAHERTQGKLRE